MTHTRNKCSESFTIQYIKQFWECHGYGQLGVKLQWIRDTFAGYQERVCANYLDEIAGVGMTISSVLGNHKNMSRMNMTDISGEKWTSGKLTSMI
jgi:hypothetical protein